MIGEVAVAADEPEKEGKGLKGLTWVPLVVIVAGAIVIGLVVSRRRQA